MQVCTDHQVVTEASVTGIEGNFPDEILQMLLTAYDSMGNDLFAESSSSSDSAQTGTEGSRAHEPAANRSRHEGTPGTDAELEANDQVSSPGEAEYRPESPRLCSDEGSSLQPFPSRPRQSARIAARQQPQSPASEQVQRSKIAHFLEQVAEGSDIDPHLALEQVGRSSVVWKGPVLLPPPLNAAAL